MENMNERVKYHLEGYEATRRGYVEGTLLKVATSNNDSYLTAYAAAFRIAYYDISSLVSIVFKAEGADITTTISNKAHELADRVASQAVNGD